MTRFEPGNGGPALRVLVTGAARRIGQMLRAHLPRTGLELRLLDVALVDEPGAITADVADLDAMTAACEGVDAVVHLAGTGVYVPWSAMSATNINGTHAVFEAARLAGVRRVVYASSNHAVGFHPLADELPDDLPAQPDTLYGVCKVFGEGIGRMYHDRYGMDVVCLRIGTCFDTPRDVRGLSTWLSPGDCARLVDAALTCPDAGFRTVWGVSRNTRRRWSLPGGEAIGYHPQDDAEEYAADITHGDPADEEAGRRLVGGAFTR